MFCQAIALSSLTTVLLCCFLTVASVEGQQAPAGVPGATQPNATNPPRDILGENLFAPELILQHGSAIGLTDVQKQAIQSEVEAVQDNLPGYQEDLRAEMESLGEQLGAAGGDEQAIMGQLDRVLDKEREIKRMQIAMLVRIRNELSAEQRQALQDVKQQLVVKQQELQKRIQEKVTRVQQGLQQRVASQRQPPPSVIQAMQNFQRLAQQNDIQGAEAALDEALLQLQLAP